MDLVIHYFRLLLELLLVLIVNAVRVWATSGWQRSTLPDPELAQDYDVACWGWWLPDPDPFEHVDGVCRDVRRRSYLLTAEEVVEWTDHLGPLRNPGSLYLENRDLYPYLP
jgi:hypothetical protein